MTNPKNRHLHFAARALDAVYSAKRLKIWGCRLRVMEKRAWPKLTKFRSREWENYDRPLAALKSRWRTVVETKKPLA